MAVQQREYSQQCCDTMCGARQVLEISGEDTLYSIGLSNHCAVHLNPAQNNIKSKFKLKNAKRNALLFTITFLIMILSISSCAW